MSEWIACEECDALHEVAKIPHGCKAHCIRCGSELYRHIKNTSEKVIAFSLAALLLMILANLFPFLSMRMGGREEHNVLISATLEFFHQGFWELGILVFLTSIFFPALVITGMLYVMLPLHFGRLLPGAFRVFRIVKKLIPWSLVGVFMLGVLIAILKLMDYASVVAGPSLLFMMGLLIAMVAAQANLDERFVWNAADNDDCERWPHRPPDDDRVSCHCCSLVLPVEHSRHDCPRCGETVHKRKTDSIARTWALIITAAMLYIPANIYPIMTVVRFGRGEPSTIFSGVVSLVEAGMWGLALLVFFASVMVPVIKLLVLAGLLVSIQLSSNWRPVDRTRLFRITELVGAWSMLDIFLIGMLVSMVKLDIFASITADTGASYFAAVVVVTLFAARSFEPRMIWDKYDQNKSK